MKIFLFISINFIIFVFYLQYLDECFKDVDMDNATECEYTIGEKLPEKGFIIPSKIKDGESTPMRDIKNAINNKLKNL